MCYIQTYSIILLLLYVGEGIKVQSSWKTCPKSHSSGEPVFEIRPFGSTVHARNLSKIYFVEKKKQTKTGEQSQKNQINIL